jgi:acyl carrier protein
MANSSKAPQRKPNRGHDEDDLFRIGAEMLGVDEQRLREDPSLLKHLDSLDVAELVMELDDEFKLH